MTNIHQYLLAILVVIVLAFGALGLIGKVITNQVNDTAKQMKTQIKIR